jgi:nicotinamide-nucleotide amidase
MGCLQKEPYMSEPEAKESPEKQVFSMLGEQTEITIGTAESITAGAVVARLARPAGASAYLQGGIVCYAYDVKEQILGVPRAVLDNPGAVSEECARYMAKGANAALGATISVSTTGIAGPAGSTTRKAVGLVYIAVTGPNGTHCEEHVFPGDRGAITNAATDQALEMLMNYLREHLSEPSG